MRTRIFGNDHGIQIFKDADGRFFIQYDTNGAVSCYVEQEISEELAAKAQMSEEDLERVLLAIEHRPAVRVHDGKPYAAWPGSIRNG